MKEEKSSCHVIEQAFVDFGKRDSLGMYGLMNDQNDEDFCLHQFVIHHRDCCIGRNGDINLHPYI